MFLSTGLALNLTTPSPLTKRRDVVALLRGPMPTPTQYLATQDFRRLDNWHVPMLARLPEPSDAQKNDFGMQESGQFSVDVPTPAENADPVVAADFDYRAEILADRITGATPAVARAANTATRINASGFVEVVNANLPRFDYDPVTLAIKGLLIEESRTNLFLQSNAFTTTWVALGTPAATQNLTGPDGAANTGWTLTDNDAGNFEGINQSVAVANDGVARTISMMVRKNVGATNTFGMNFGYSGGTPVSATPRLNADTGSLVNSGTLKTAAVGWWGIWQSLTNNNSGNTSYGVSIYPATAVWPAADAVTAQGSQGLYGVQLEVGAFPTSYIPTGAAAVTRNADAVTVTNLAPFFDSTEGRIVVDFIIDRVVAASAFIFDLSDNTNNNRLYLFATAANALQCDVVADGVAQATMNIAGLTASALMHAEITYKNGEFSLQLNGGAIQTYIGGKLPAVNRLTLGSTYAATAFMNGTIQRLRFCRTARRNLIWMTTLFKNQPVDLDLLTRVYREDGTAVDFINERRGFVKSVTRKREGITLNVVDVDRVAMKTMFPIKTFTIADWPFLFVDHVNRCVCQGVGLGEKVPCTYVDNTAGAYKYAVCEIPAGTVAPTVLTVYRGKQSGQGQIVSATEYVVSQTTVAGTTYLLLTFTREQVDFDNQKFVIEADVNSPISRVAADEIARLLQLVGLTVDAADFADAAAYHLTINAKVDAWYTKQVSIDAIITPLLQVARGWLSQTLGGLYSIFVDRPRTAQRLLWDDSDEISVEERSEPEVAKTITLRYRPRPAQRSDYAGDLNRTTTGANGEKIFSNEFVRDHDTADRLLDYLAKKESRAAIKATINGVVLTPGELVAVNSPLVFDGWKSLAAAQITRVTDGCQITGEEYTESDYSYTPGTLPADATNLYSPDYTYTPPLAPTALAVISQGITVDVDGKGTAYALIRAVPPAVNWAKLTAQIRNTTTNEVYQAQLTLAGANYEAVLPGLRPNQAHQVIAWATNANGLDGVAAAAVGFTSATYSAAPSAPTGLTGQAIGADQYAFTWTPPAGQNIKGFQPFLKIGGGSFVAQPLVDAAIFTIPLTNANFGTSHQFKVQTVDRFGNNSADSSVATFTPAAYLYDAHINPLGVGTVSLASQAANDAKVKLTSSTTSGSIGSGATVDFVIPAKATGVRIQQTDAAGHLQMFAASSTTGNGVAIKNIDASSHNYSFQCYYIDT